MERIGASKFFKAHIFQFKFYMEWMAFCTNSNAVENMHDISFVSLDFLLVF